jgi:glycosyltransferase involved in cell wall biosynthesis
MLSLGLSIETRHVKVRSFRARERKMKIAFVGYPTQALLPPYHGSMGVQTYTIASALAKTCEVLVYGLENKQMGAKSGFYQGARYRFFPSSFKDRLLFRGRETLSSVVQLSSPISSSNLLFPSFGRQVAMDLEKEQCDIIHIQHCSQYVPIVRAFNPKAKIVLQIHAEWFSQCHLAVIERRLRSLDLLLTVSDYLTGKTHRDIPALADRCETMYNGIDTQEFNREKDYALTARRNEKRLLYLGGVWPHKGAHVLLDAFEIVVGRYPNVRLDIVGPQGGTYPLEECFDLADETLLPNIAPFFAKKRLALLKGVLGFPATDQDTYLGFLKAKLVGELAGKVTFHGFLSRPELVDHYYDSDVFVFPPIWNEGFGCTPVEAMAAGTPVVVTRSGGIVETVRDNETGFLVEKNDCRALAEAIIKLLENDVLRERMGRAARKRALEHFRWERIVAAMHNRYQSLCRADSTVDNVTEHVHEHICKDLDYVVPSQPH